MNGAHDTHSFEWCSVSTSDGITEELSKSKIYKMLISDVVHLSGTYLILLIRIRLYLCRLDYILSMFLLYLPFRMFLLSSFGTSYCSFLIVLFRDIPFVPNGLLSCITIDSLDLASRTFCR